MIRIPPALKNRGFALIWVGLMISMVGTADAAMGFVLAYQPLSKDPIAVSIVGGVTFRGRSLSFR